MRKYFATEHRLLENICHNWFVYSCHRLLPYSRCGDILLFITKPCMHTHCISACRLIFPLTIGSEFLHVCCTHSKKCFCLCLWTNGQGATPKGMSLVGREVHFDKRCLHSCPLGCEKGFAVVRNTEELGCAEKKRLNFGTGCRQALSNDITDHPMQFVAHGERRLTTKNMLPSIVRALQ